MATRTVSIKIVLDGYQEYRNSIAALNAQNKLLDAQLKDIDMRYGKNSTSADALAKKQELLAQKQEVARKKLAESEAMLDKATKAMNFYKNAMDMAQKEVEETTKALEDYKNGTYEGSKSLEELEEDQRKAVSALSEATRMYTQSANETARLTKEVSNAKKETGEYTPEVEGNTKAVTENTNQVVKTVDVWKRFTDILGFAKDATVKVKDAIKDSIKAFIDYEAAFTNVEKTVDGSQRQLAKLNDELKEMSSTMPYAAKDIANIASIAGQLGIGVNDVRDFTEVMLGLGTATNLTAEDASTMLAQFQNITGFEADKIKNIASVIVDLGNNSATTERDIMEMAQRFASAGTLAGLSAPEILGMAAALSSVGIGAEAGGTSLSKMTQKIQNAVEKGGKDLNNFARVAGVSADDFAKAWKESPVEAINMFLAGMGKTYEEGDSVLQLLDELGFGEVRLRNATQALALSEKDLGYYVGMANDAFKDTVAYDTEVGRFLDTTQSNVQILKNNFDLLKIQLGEALSPAFDTLVESVGSLIGTISDFIESHPIVIEAISALFKILSDGIGIIDTLFSSLNYYNVDLERFGSVALSTTDVINDSTRAYGEQLAAINQTRDEAQKYLDILKNLESDGKITRDEQEKYNEAIEALKGLYPDLNIEIDKNTGMLKDGADALERQIDGWKNLAIAEARSQKLTKLYGQLYDIQDELSENVKKYGTNAKYLERLEKEAGEYKDQLLELERAYASGEITTYEYEQAQKELGDKIQTNADLAYDLRQEQNDLEAAMIKGREAMTETQTAIHNWEEGTKNATKATEENTKANEKNAESFDQSKKAAEGGQKTIKAYVDGQEKYFTTEEWKEYRKTLKNNTDKAMDDASADAYQKGKNTSSQFGKGISDNSKTIKNALSGVVSGMTFDVKISQSSNNALKFAASLKPKFAEGGIVTREMDAIVGEAGTEAIIPLKKLPDIMTKYMQNQQSMSNFYGSRSKQEQRDVDTIVSLLNRYLPKMSNQQVVLDSNKLVGTLAPKIDTYFTNQMIAEGRGQ